MTNVLLIVCDALRPTNLPEWGYHRMTAPNITKLCDEATVYRNAYSHFNFTTPSIATILTGKYFYENGIWRLYYPSEEEMKNSTAEKWKWKLHCPTLATNLKETHRTIMINEIFVDLLDKDGILWSDFEFAPSNYSGQKGKTVHPDSAMPIHPLAEQTTNEALKYIEDEVDDRPFFMYVHYWDTHWPPSVPPEKVDEFYDGTNPINLHELYSSKVTPDARRMVREQIASRTAKRDLNFLKAWYDAEIKYMDENIGRLLEAIPEDTLIVITADHGEAMGEHNGASFTHVGSWLYEEVVRVPLIIKYPRIYENDTIYERIENRKIYDLVMGYLEKGYPQDIEQDYIYCVTRESDQFTPHLDVLVKGDLKLFAHDYGTESYGFNLKDDPNEENPLFVSQGFGELVQILKPLMQIMPPKPEGVD
jgi:arylsulfatase A-like enzyme